MSKRKEYVDDSSPIGSTANKEKRTQVEEEYLKDVLLRSSLTLFRALKLGKAFERQKLGRRQKAAKSSSATGEVDRLEAEVNAVKRLDLYNIAETHLFKSILKIKSFSSKLPSFVQSRVGGEERPPDTAYANVQARLFNSRPVKTAMDQCMVDIRSALGLTENVQPKKKRLRKKDFQQISHEHLGEDSAAEGKDNSGRISDANGVSTKDPAIDSHKVSESELVNINSGKHNSKRAEPSFESLKSCADDMDQTPSWDTASQSVSWTPSDLSIGPQLQQTATTKLPKPIVMANSSSFFPSLMGGYWSGSGSDGEENIGRNDVPRRNRRGQRARRWIAEQKFGQNANHVKRQPHNATGDDGWDLKKGAQPERHNTDKRASRFKRKNASGGVSSGANSYPVKSHQMNNQKSRQTESTLHPSWEAARKAKEQKVAMAFQGTRIVFD